MQNPTQREKEVNRDGEMKDCVYKVQLVPGGGAGREGGRGGRRGGGEEPHYQRESAGSNFS